MKLDAMLPFMFFSELRTNF